MSSTDIQPVDKMSATQEYALAFYNLLAGQAVNEPLLLTEDETDQLESDDVLVWRGKLMEAFESMKVSNVFYSRIRRIFLKYDCVTYLQRGTKSYDSVLVLNHPPPQILSAEDLTVRPGDATLQAVAERLSEAEHKIAVLEAWRDSLGGLNILELAIEVKRLSDLSKDATTGGSNGKAA